MYNISRAVKTTSFTHINKTCSPFKKVIPISFRSYSNAITNHYKQFNNSSSNSRHIIGSIFVALSVSGIYGLSKLQSDDKTDSVSVISSVDPLPKHINKPLLTEFELIGYGVREVSFLKMKVYALGVYIAKEDIPLVKQIFNSKFIESFYEDIKESTNIEQHKEHLSNALADPQVSNILIKNLLSSNIRFTARICAIRNTDLSHLRDGFIRTIRNNPNYSKLMKSEDEYVGERITKGLDDLRDIFNSAKVSAKKNSLVYMEIDQNQNIRVSLEVMKSAKDSTERNDPVFIGTIKEPFITELLFESYLGAEKPLVSAVQTTSSASLVSLL
jgi:hypothetical protein